MPTLPSDKLRRWRIHPHAIDVYLVLLKPTLVFRARVVGTSFNYPIDDIAYTAVEVGAAADVERGMTVRIGTQAGLADLGTTFVRQTPFGSNPIEVGRSSRGRARPGEVDLQANAVIEVWDMREVWAEAPYILPDGTTFKKFDYPFSANSDPVANIGPDFADFVDPSSNTLTVYFDTAGGGDASDDFPSFTTAPGATIVSYAWDFADGTPSTSSSATPGNVSFPPGKRWVSLQVNDSNGRTHTAYALIVACEKTGANAPIYQFQITEHTQQITGQTFKAQIKQAIDRAEYPAGTKVLVFAKERYGTTQILTGSISGDTVTGLASTDRLYTGMRVAGTGISAGTTVIEIISGTSVRLSASQSSGSYTLKFKPTTTPMAGGWYKRRGLLFSGWLVDEANQLDWRAEGLQKNVDITAVDVVGRLQKLPGFPQEVRRKTTPTKFTEMKEPNIERYIHYILNLHSNALSLADFKWAATDYPFSWLSSDGRSLYDQADQRAQAVGARLACDEHGRLMISFDPMLQAVSDRTGVEQVEIGVQDWTSLRWRRDYVPRNHWLRGASLLISTADVDTADPARSFVISPGRAPGQGLSATQQNYQLVKSRDEHFTREGNRYAAKLNAESGLWEVALASGGSAGIEVARQEWTRLIVDDASKSLRGESFPGGKRFLPAQIRYTYDQDNRARRAVATLEEEVIGTPAVDDPQPTPDTRPFPSTPLPGWTPYTPPPINWGDERTIVPDAPPDDVPITAIGLVKEGEVWRATWPSGTLNLESVGPDSGLQQLVQEAIRFQVDPGLLKRVYLFGKGGILRCSNILATTPAWSSVMAAQEYQTGGGLGYGGAKLGAKTWSRTFDFIQGDQGFTASYLSKELMGQYYQGTGWWSVTYPTDPTKQFISIAAPLYRACTFTKVKVYYRFTGPPTQNVTSIDPVASTTTNNSPSMPTSVTYTSTNGSLMAVSGKQGQVFRIYGTITGAEKIIEKIEVEGKGDDPFIADWTQEIDFANGQQHFASFADGVKGGGAVWANGYWTPDSSQFGGVWRRTISIRADNASFLSGGYIRYAEVHLSEVTRGAQLTNEDTDVIFDGGSISNAAERFAVQADERGTVVVLKATAEKTGFDVGYGAKTVGVRIMISSANSSGGLSGSAKLTKLVFKGSYINPFNASDVWEKSFDFTQSDHDWYSTNQDGSVPGPATYVAGTGWQVGPATDAFLTLASVATPTRVTYIEIEGTTSANSTPHSNNGWYSTAFQSGLLTKPAAWQNLSGDFVVSWTGDVAVDYDGNGKVGLRIFWQVLGASKSITIRKVTFRGIGNPGLDRWEKEFDFTVDPYNWSVYDFNASGIRAQYDAGQGFRSVGTSPTAINIEQYSGTGQGGLIYKAEVTMDNDTGVTSSLIYFGSNNTANGNSGDSAAPWEWNGKATRPGESERMIIKTTVQNTYAGHIQKIKVYGVGLNPYRVTGDANVTLTEELISDFQPYPNKSGAWCWLSLRYLDDVLTLYFCYTLNNFAAGSLRAVPLDYYVETEVPSIAINPHNWLDVEVTGSGRVWRSTNGGASFANSSGDVVIYAGGGPIVWNWSTGTPNTKNQNVNNLIILQGKNSSNQIRVVRGPAGTPVTIVTDALRYAESPMSLRVLPRNLNKARYVARNGYFYASDDAATSLTWAYQGTAPDGGSNPVHRGMTLWPTDPNFAFVFGKNVLCWTEDKGANWTNMWSDYDTWRDGEWGSGVGLEIQDLIFDLTKVYKAPVV